MDMRVALINNAQGSTGCGRYAFELGRAFGTGSQIEVDHIFLDRGTYSLKKVTRTREEHIGKLKKNPLLDNNLLMRFERLPNLLFDYRAGRFLPKNYDAYHLANQLIAGLAYYRNVSAPVITVHDLIHYCYPNNFMVKQLSRALYSGIRKGATVIAVSRATADDLVAWGISPAKIKVVHEGISTSFRVLSDLELMQFRHKYALSENRRYILHVGSDERRKNVITLIKAFHRLKTLAPMQDVRLIKVNPFSPRDRKAITELGLEKDVIQIDHVPDEDLVAVYNMADVFVFPSFYEGFGFPPLEAMACGTPVITSNTSSLPEVVGDAGITLAPDDVYGLANAMQRLLHNDSMRQDMTKSGLAQAKRFTWERCAEETFNVYKNLC